MRAAAELREAGVAANGLWPRSVIATAAVQNLLGGDEVMAKSRTPEIVADAGYASDAVYTDLANRGIEAFIPPQPNMLKRAGGQAARTRCKTSRGVGAAIELLGTEGLRDRFAAAAVSNEGPVAVPVR